MEPTRPAAWVVFDLLIGRAATSQLIDRLEGKGLVARIRDQRDQRRVFVWLSEEGRNRVASLAGAS